MAVDGICGDTAADAVNLASTCEKNGSNSRMWIDLGVDITLRTIVVLERQYDFERIRSLGDSKIIRGCPASLGPDNPNGKNYDSPECLDCGSQTGLQNNHALTCGEDFTVSVLFVQLVEYSEKLQLNEIFAYKEITIGYTGNSLGVDMQVTTNPVLEGYIGTGIWKDQLILWGQEEDASPYMAQTDSTEIAQNTYITLTFSVTDEQVYIGVESVLVIGRTDFSFREQGINTDVYAMVTTGRYSCETGLSNTCSTVDCNSIAYGIEIRKTVDYQALSIGAIIVFECAVFDLTSTSTIPDGTYTQGNEATDFTLELSLDSQCTLSNFLEQLQYTYVVSLDGEPVEDSSYFTFNYNQILVHYTDETTTLMAEDLYTVSISVSPIIGTYGTFEEISQSFNVQTYNYCYQESQKEILDMDTSSIENLERLTTDPKTDYQLYEELNSFIIGTSYATCFDVLFSFSCDLTVSDNFITFDSSTGTLTVDQLQNQSLEGNCNLQLDLVNLYDSTAEVNEVLDTFDFQMAIKLDCTSDHLVFDAIYIASLQSPYDIFSQPSTYSYDPSLVVSTARENCDEINLQFSYSSGPQIYSVDEDDPETFQLWSSDPDYAAQILEFTFTAMFGMEVDDTITTNLQYLITNTCSNVVLEPTSIADQSTGQVTTSTRYENAADPLVLEFSAFDQDIEYCPIIYTVHLIDEDGDEVTWNRESNPAESDYTYEDIPDTDFSDNAKSGEYLTISRPDGENQGTITISNTIDYHAFLGLYTLELRGHHQDQMVYAEIEHFGYNCEINVSLDVPTPIDYYLSTGPATSDFTLSIAQEEYCAWPDEYTLACEQDQDFCDRGIDFDLLSGELTITDEISSGSLGLVDVSLTINPGEPNEVTTSFTVLLIDPCELNNTITIYPFDGVWPADIWITDPTTFAIDTSTQFYSETSPPGADCGAYQVTFTFVNDSGESVPEGVTLTINEYSLYVDFAHVMTTIGNWNIQMFVQHADYNDVSNPSASETYTFLGRDPCIEANVITIDTALLESTWLKLQSIFDPNSYDFDIDTMVSSESIRPEIDCGPYTIEESFITEQPETLDLRITIDPPEAYVHFDNDTTSIGFWDIQIVAQHTRYQGDAYPKDVYVFNFESYNPCDDSEVLTIGTEYILDLYGTYDLFKQEVFVTWDPDLVAQSPKPEVREEHCGDLLVSLAYTQGPDIYYQDEIDYTKFQLWSSDPTFWEGGETTILTFTALHAWYEITTKTATLEYLISDTCADVVMNVTEVIDAQTGVVNDIIYQNGNAAQLYIFDPFGKDGEYCTIVYTVHLLDLEGNEVTWNREDNPATYDPAYAPILNETFSELYEPSDELLTISRPTEGNPGFVSVFNGGPIDTFVGSYILQVRGNHQNQTVSYDLNYAGICDPGSITSPDTSEPIIWQATNIPQTQDVPEFTSSNQDQCGITPTYKFSLQDESGETPTYLADYVSYNNETHQAEYNGQYPEEADPEVPIELNLVLTAYFDDYEINFASVEFDLFIAYDENAVTIIPTDNGPKFASEPGTATPNEGEYELPGATAGEAWDYTLPSVVDTTEGTLPENIVIEVDVGSAIFILYDEASTTLIIDPGTTDSITEETFEIGITLTNELGDSKSIVLLLTITAPEPDPEEQIVDIKVDTEDEAPTWVPPTMEELDQEEEPVVNLLKVLDSDVDDRGQVDMVFTRQIALPDELADIFGDNFESSRRLQESNNSLSADQILENSQTNDTTVGNDSDELSEKQKALKSFNLTDYVTMEVVGGSYDSSTPDELSFSPVLVEFTPTSFKIDLDFDRPLEVSYGTSPDYVEIEMVNTSLFVDKQTGLQIEPGFKQRIYLPKLIDTSPKGIKEIAALEEQGQQVQSIADAATGASLVICIIMACSMKALWNLLNFAQIVFYLKRYSPNVPGNMSLVFEMLNASINLTFIDYDGMFSSVNEWANENMGMQEEAAKSKSIGKDGASFTKNIGLYMLAAVALILIICFLMLLVCLYKRSKCLRPAMEKLIVLIKKKMFYNSFLRTLLTASLNFDNQVATMVYLQVYADEENKNETMLGICLCIYIILGLVPFIVAYLLLKWRHKLQDPAIRMKFESLYIGVKTEKWHTTIYPAIFLFRRFILVIVATFFQNTKSWLVLAFIQMQMFYLMYLFVSKVKEDKMENALEVMNETILLFFGYFMIFTTDFIPMVNIQYYYGWVLVYQIGLVMFIDYSYMFANTCYVAFVVKKHQAKLNKIAAARVIKIQQINASKKFMTQQKLDGYEYNTLQKIKFHPRTFKLYQQRKEQEQDEEIQVSARKMISNNQIMPKGQQLRTPKYFQPQSVYLEKPLDLTAICEEEENGQMFYKDDLANCVQLDDIGFLVKTVSSREEREIDFSGELHDSYVSEQRETPEINVQLYVEGNSMINEHEILSNSEPNTQEIEYYNIKDGGKVNLSSQSKEHIKSTEDSKNMIMSDSGQQSALVDNLSRKQTLNKSTKTKKPQNYVHFDLSDPMSIEKYTSNVLSKEISNQDLDKCVVMDEEEFKESKESFQSINEFNENKKEEIVTRDIKDHTRLDQSSMMNMTPAPSKDPVIPMQERQNLFKRDNTIYQQESMIFVKQTKVNIHNAPKAAILETDSNEYDEDEPSELNVEMFRKAQPEKSYYTSNEIKYSDQYQSSSSNINPHPQSDQHLHEHDFEMYQDYDQEQMNRAALFHPTSQVRDSDDSNSLL